MENKTIEVKDGDLMAAICMALRKSQASKAEKDYKEKYKTEVIPGGDWAITDM